MTLVPGASLSTLTVSAGESIGKWGVDVFVLISGYFLSSNKSVLTTIRHATAIYVQLWTTSVLCLVAAVSLSWYQVGIKDIVKATLPFTYGEYWFATAYLILLLLSPFINFLLVDLSKRRHAELIALMLFLWSVLPTVFPHSSLKGNELPNFVTLYIIASYIRKYVAIGNAGRWAASCMGLLAVMAVSSVSIQALTARTPHLIGRQMYFVGSYSPLTIAAAVAALMTALSMRPRHSAFINEIASGTFGVYLLTEHPLVRHTLWDNIVHTQIQFYSNILPALMVGSALCVFLAALTIELLRKRIIQRPVMQLIGLCARKANLQNMLATYNRWSASWDKPA
jgi:surface polysaccharide O-acyltransferase-like enzyme